MMEMEKFTQKAQEALLKSQQIAREYQHQNIESIHILGALISQEEGIVSAITTKIAGSILALREARIKEIDKRPKITGYISDIGLTRSSSDVLNAVKDFQKGWEMISFRLNISC